jgi:hypothetical protein
LMQQLLPATVNTAGTTTAALTARHTADAGTWCGRQTTRLPRAVRPHRAGYRLACLNLLSS